VATPQRVSFFHQVEPAPNRGRPFFNAKARSRQERKEENRLDSICRKKAQEAQNLLRELHEFTQIESLQG
jgi:hypothetical protein